jgi:hypothetical protein
MRSVEKPVLPPAFWQSLATENPLGLRNITPRDAEDWFDLKWPVYEEYAAGAKTKPNHKLRIKQWWARLSQGELDRARTRGVEVRRSEQATALSAIAEKFLHSVNQPLRTDLPPLNTSRGGKRG